MAKQAGVNCPNCGSKLYTGHENVNGDSIAVCMDNETPPNGCLAAWDLAELAKDPEIPFGPWSVPQQPEVGSDIEPPVVEAPSSDLTKAELQAPASENTTLASPEPPAE